MALSQIFSFHEGRGSHRLYAVFYQLADVLWNERPTCAMSLLMERNLCLAFNLPFPVRAFIY
jgi:hypothetical protein